MNLGKDKIIVPLILIVSVIVHMINFGFPASVVFDEVHIGHYISGYLRGAYIFDVHPPLGRLILLFFAIILGADSSVNFDNIGNLLPEWAIVLRIIPTLAGIMIPVLVFLILRQLKLSKRLSAMAGLLLCFENSLIIHSRYLLTDSFLIVFGLISILFYLLYRNRFHLFGNLKVNLLISIVFASLAFSVKWTGLSFFLIIIVYEISHRKLRSAFKFLFASSIIFFFIYAFIFSLHFTLLPRSGAGDDFMSPQFQKTLIGSKFYNDDNIKLIGYWTKFAEVNVEMLRANTRLTNKHDYSSKWYTWPIMTRGVYYWNKDNIDGEGINSYLYLIGNPVIYWLGLLSVLILFIRIIMKRRSINLDSQYFIVFCYLVNFIPFIFIGRTMFLYHYQSALIFSIMAISVLISGIKNQSNQNKMIASVLMLSFVVYIYFSPITYGFPISLKTLESMMWIKSWR